MEFGFVSSNLDFGKVWKDETVTRSAFVQILDPDHTKIIDIEVSSPHIEAKRLENFSRPEHEGEVEIQVTISPGLSLGRIKEEIIIKSNLDSKPDDKLRLDGTIVGDVEAVPDEIRFVYSRADSEQAQLPHQRIQIVNRSSETTLEILEARDPQNRLELSLKTIEDGQRYELTATLKREALGAENRAVGTILVTTDNPEQREITVTYSIIQYGDKRRK